MTPPRQDSIEVWAKQNTAKEIYLSVHRWLHSKYGQASYCSFKDCNKKSSSFEWALIRGKKYEKRRENFVQLCQSCHARYDCTDQKREKMRAINTGRKRGAKFSRTMQEKSSFKKASVVQLKDGEVVAVYPSLAAAARALGGDISTIWHAINGPAKSGFGYQWKYAAALLLRESIKMK